MLTSHALGNGSSTDSGTATMDQLAKLEHEFYVERVRNRSAVLDR